MGCKCTRRGIRSRSVIATDVDDCQISSVAGGNNDCEELITEMRVGELRIMTGEPIDHTKIGRGTKVNWSARGHRKQFHYNSWGPFVLYVTHEEEEKNGMQRINPLDPHHHQTLPKNHNRTQSRCTEQSSASDREESTCHRGHEDGHR